MHSTVAVCQLKTERARVATIKDEERSVLVCVKPGSLQKVRAMTTVCLQAACVCLSCVCTCRPVHTNHAVCTVYKCAAMLL